MIPILMYHEVNTDEKNENGKKRMGYSCCLSVSQFAEQIRYLYKNNFYSLSLEEILEYNNGKNTTIHNKKAVVITFDDGHSGNYKYAFPILKKYGFSAIFFVATNWIDKKNMVSWNQLKEMVDEGMDVQSHTVSHVPLSTVSDVQIKNELLESKRIIEKNLEVKVEFLGLPHGDFDSRVILIAKQIGYKNVFTSQPEYFQENKDSFLIGRIEIRKKYDINYFISIVEKRCQQFNLLRLRNKIKFYLRSYIGVDNYRKLYRLINKIEPRKLK